MALNGLIKKQTIIIDDHKRGSQEVKNWDDPSSDIHIDKTTNFPLDGKRQKVRIRIPINSDRPIKIENGKRQELNEIPKKLYREIRKALKNKQIRNRFIFEIIDVLDNFETALSNVEKAKSILMRIAKHFGLDWPTETIINYAEDVLLAYTLVYQKNPKEEYFAKIDRHKIEIGQYCGYAKQLRKLNR